MKRKENRIGSSRGESMLMALVLLMVFMAVGASVLGAGAGSTAAASARIVDRQVYYAARSVLDTLDKAMRTGGLGLAVQNEAFGALVAGGGSVALPETEQNFTITLTNAPEGLTSIAGTLTYRGSAQLTSGGVGVPQQASVSLTADIAYDLVYRDKTYSMQAKYGYDGFGVSANGESPVWTGEWKVQKVY